MQMILHFIAAHWLALLIFAGVILVVLAIYTFFEVLALHRHGPRDITGNGITIGKAKAFDNRSLALRIERLSNSLDQLKVVNQNATENISAVQKTTSTQSSRSLTLEVKASPAKTGNDGSSKEKEGAKDAQSESTTASSDAAKAESKPTVALSAGDILSDQLNLASQIMNLEMLYERSLTDRLMNDRSRLQTVLGFQVSITPPGGFENCVAIVEVSVRMKPTNPPAENLPVDDHSQQPAAVPVSLVALIPHEKTYNAQTISTSASSIGGSAVASVLSLGFSSKGESRQLFIHRDSDTIAFERNPGTQPTLFLNDSTATVFGWEFRPVLGRTTVSAGIRQMLAVIAVPIPENATAEEITLEIITRSYWRRYDRKQQTSRPNWSLPPWRVDLSKTFSSSKQELPVPNTAKIQQALAPKVADIKWVNSGGGRATVIVTGANFFSGTKVVIGGTVHREEDSNLTLKSNQALEFETKIESLVSGDCVLSGRFGSSLQLTIPLEKRPVESLEILKAQILPGQYTKASRIRIYVKGMDGDGAPKDLTVADIQKLPEPILFVGTEQVQMPYDYWDIESADPDMEFGGIGTGTGSGTGGGSGGGTGTGSSPPALMGTGSGSGSGSGMEASPLSSPLNLPADGAADGLIGAGSDDPWPLASPPNPIKLIRVEAWIPKELARNPSVAFRIPFCGFEYQASVPWNPSEEPTVTRMGGDAQMSVFRIFYPAAPQRQISVQLDQIYRNPPQLEKTQDNDYRLELPTSLVSQYQNLVVRIEESRTGSWSTGRRGESYLIPIPTEDKPKAKTTIDTNTKPPQIKKGSLGPVEWSGMALDAIKSATLYASAPRAASPPPPNDQKPGTPAQYTAYENGKRIEVYFAAGSTDTPGRAEVEFQTASGKPFRVPFYITNETS